MQDKMQLRWKDHNKNREFGIKKTYFEWYRLEMTNWVGRNLILTSNDPFTCLSGRVLADFGNAFGKHFIMVNRRNGYSKNHSKGSSEHLNIVLGHT